MSSARLTTRAVATDNAVTASTSWLVRVLDQHLAHRTKPTLLSNLYESGARLNRQRRRDLPQGTLEETCSSSLASTTTSSNRQTCGPNVCLRSSRRRAPTSSRLTDVNSGCTRTSARPPWD